MRDLASATRAGRLDVSRFQRAVVTAVAGANKVTVSLDGAAQLVDLPAVAGPTAYAAGDLVLVARDSSGPVVLGKVGAAPAPAEPPPAAPVPPPSTLTQRTVTILPSSTDSYRAGQGWRGDGTVRQGDYIGEAVYQGCAFYGAQLAGLGADLSAPRSAVLTYVRQQGGVFGAQSPTFHTLAQRTRPSGAPTRLSSGGEGTPVAVNRSASWQLPAGLLDELLDGTAGGLGVYVGSSSPYIVLSGRSGSSVSMSLKVTFSA